MKNALLLPILLTSPEKLEKATMTAPSYPFIHPLLGTDDNLAGYLIELPEHCKDFTVLQQLAKHPTFDQMDTRQPWLIPAIALDNTLPDRLIPVFTDTGLEQLASLEAELRQNKRRLALQSTLVGKLPATGTWHYLMISAAQAHTLPPFTLQSMSIRTHIIVTGVHNHSDHEWAMANACALSTGEFLLSRANPGKKADITRQKMIHLLALIAEDADTQALDNIFRQEAKLSYSLLRLVNSAAIAPRSPIESFAQAINLLGRRQLGRWLQLLVYADTDGKKSINPLLIKAATRGRMMELLASKESTNSDCAFMVGCFSLLDVLLNLPMQEILAQLPLPQDCHDALARHQGALGQLLTALAAADGRNLSTAQNLLAELNITVDDFIDAQLESINWANKIRNAV